jgi:hypothetical protein
VTQVEQQEDFGDARQKGNTPSNATTFSSFVTHTARKSLFYTRTPLDGVSVAV